jgi:uncharacterized membrane protein YkvA (DUF1232 family)
MKKQLNSVQRFFQGLKRACLVCAALVSATAFWWAYTSAKPVAASRGGRAALWTAGHAVAPMIDATPWWAWGVVGVALLYVWTRHRFLGTVVACLVAGVALAL